MLIVNPLNSELAFPILECFHIAGFAVAIGSVALVDFRLLGLGLSRETPAELSSNTGWWMLGGLIVAIFSGLLLFTTDPDMYYLNWSFVIKMACLIAAITFNYTIHRKVESGPAFRPPGADWQPAFRWVCGSPSFLGGSSSHSSRTASTEPSKPMILSFLEWLQNVPFFAELRGSAYAYPIVLALHLTFISLFAGMLLATDLRLLGWTLQRHPIADIIDKARWPKRIGFVLAATCGFLLFGCKAEEYSYNPFFRAKLVLFALVAVHAAVFRGSVYNRAAELDRAPVIPARARLAASLSIVLWLCMVTAGRSIGYLQGRAGMHYL